MAVVIIIDDVATVLPESAADSFGEDRLRRLAQAVWQHTTDGAAAASENTPTVATMMAALVAEAEALAQESGQTPTLDTEAYADALAAVEALDPEAS